MSSPVGASPADPPLPPKFSTIEHIRNLPDEKILARSVISNVFGFVTDFMPTTKCGNGTGDYKCAFEIKDLSTKFETHGFKVDVFWKQAENLPKFSGPGDVVLMRNIKVQMRGGNISLLANYLTDFHILPSSKIPSTMSKEVEILWQSYPPGRTRSLPSFEETKYLVWAHAQTQDMGLPSTMEFQEKSTQAVQGGTRGKFSLLKDVKPDGKWHNILGEVIRLYDSSLFTLYFSDYTYHKHFHNYSWSGEGEEFGSRDGDEFGYSKSHDKHKDKWPGPFGQHTIQLTLFDEHASFAREHLEVGQWVLLSNVQIQMGRNGGNLEGFLRGDRGRVNVRILEQADDAEFRDSRWEAALRRKLEYKAKQEKQKKKFLGDADGLGSKRKADDEEPLQGKGKRRRKAARAAAERAAAESEAKKAARLNLNDNVKCAFPEIEPTPVERILQPEMILRKGGTRFPSSFTCRKYRANVRVVDYAPHRIEDFAVWRRVSEFDQLSDYSGGEDTDVEEDLRSYRSGKGYTKKKWEWRFWLRVEDADPKGSKQRMWMLVDNSAAQGLLGLEADAANLRKESRLLAALKEQLFKLWGNLEEQKSAALPPPTDEHPPSSIDSTLKPPAGAQPNLDSDDETEAPNSKSSVLDTRLSALNDQSAGTSINAKDLILSNKAFTCCIQQYGIKEPEEDRSKADAGDGRRWQRMFGLFGTQIQ